MSRTDAPTVGQPRPNRQSPRARRAPAAKPTGRLGFALHPVSLAVCLLGGTPAALALPQGAVPTVGQATVRQMAPGDMQIVQTTPRAGLDWTSFSIAAGERVNVLQPARSSVLLNRVVGDDPSLIYGSLTSNGSVWLINPRGIVFGANSRVDVGSLVASTLSITAGDLASGRLQLGQGAGAGELRAEGSITATDGTVALVAPQLTHTGRTEARRIGLAAAGDVLVDVEGDGLVFFNVSSGGLPARLAQLGNVLSSGGSVELRAAARAGLSETVLNTEGVVQARGLGLRGGRIVIDGGTQGITRVAGTLDTTSTSGQGGDVLVQGERILLDRTAVLDASGATGGGQVRVGGDFQGQNPDVRHAGMVSVAPGARLAANALVQGDGGRVIVWSDQATRFAGRADARGGAQGGDGGLVEVSSKGYLGFSGQSDRSAPQGRAGTLLLDPTDLTIQAGNADLNDDGTPGDDLSTGSIGFADPGANSQITSGAVVTQLIAGPVTLQATNNIFVNDAISSGSGNSLTLSAGENIAVSQPITVGGGLRLSANDAGHAARSGTGRVATTAALTAGGTLTLDNGGGSGVHAIGANLTAGTLAVTGGLELVADSTFSLSSGTPITLAADISGTGGLTKSGSASLELTGANTYTGSTTVAQGTLTLSAAVASTSIGVDGGTLALSATNLLPNTATVAVASGATLAVAAAETIGQLTLAGTVTGAGTLTASTYTLAGATISARLGTGTLTSTGNSAINQTVGATTVTVTGGTLTLNVDELLPDTAAVQVQPGATLALATAAGDETIASLNLAGTLTGAGNLIATGTTTLNGANVETPLQTDVLEHTGGSSTLRAPVVVGTSALVSGGTLTVGDGATAGSLGTPALDLDTGATLAFARDSQVTWATNITGTGGTLRNDGSGGLLLNAVAGSVDAVAVTAGTLTLGNNNSNRISDTAAVTVASGATLAMGNRDETVGSLDLSGTLSGGVGRTFTATNGSTLRGTVPTPSVVNAALAGGTLTVAGDSTLNDAASHTTVDINGGTLTLGASGALATTASVTVAQGAGLSLVNDQALGAFTLAGTLTGGANGVSLAGTAVLQDGAIANAEITSSALQTSGAVAVNRIVTATSISVNSGTLTLGAANLVAGNAAISVAAASTLTANGNDNIGALTLAGTLNGSGTLTASSLQANGTGAAVQGSLAIDGAGNATVADAGRLTVGTGGSVSFGTGEFRLGNGSELAFTRGGNFSVGNVTGTSAGILTHGGSGTLTFTGAAANVTAWRVNGGGTLAMDGTAADLATLDISANSSLVLGNNNGTRLNNAAAVTVATGSSLVTGNSAETVGSLTLGGTLGGNATLNASNYILQTGGTVNTPLGSGALRVTGAAQLNSAAAAGTVRVENGGTLTMAASGSLSAGAGVTVDTGGTLALGAATNTVGTLQLGGTLNGTGLLLTASTVTLTEGGIANANLGGGSLQVTGNAQLNGSSAASTVNVQNGGTLTLAAPGGRLTATPALTVASGGTFTMAGDEFVDTYQGAGTVNGTGVLHSNSVTLNNSSLSVALTTGSLLSDGTSSVLADVVVTTSAQVNTGELTVGNGTAGSLTLQGAATLTVQNGATLAFDRNTAVTVGDVAGTGSLRQKGSGALHLAGTVASAAVAVDAGTLVLDNGSTNRLADGAQVTVASGATLRLDDVAETVGTLHLGGTLATGGTLTTTGTSTLQTGSSVNANLVANRVDVTGAATLNATLGTPTLQVTATGNLSVAAGALDAGTAVAVSNLGTLQLATDQTVQSLALAGTLGGAGALNATAGATLQTGGQAHARLAGPLLTVTGSSTLAAAAAAGTVNINAGTLTLAAADLLDDAATVTVASGAGLALGGNDRVGSLVTAGTVSGSAHTLQAGTYTLQTNATVSAQLGTGSFTAEGNATLDGTSAASLVQVSGGVLTLGSAGRLAGTAAVTVDNGATLQLGGTETVASLTLAGTLGGASQTLNATTTTLQTGALVTANLGAGSLVVTGNAQLSGSTQATAVDVQAGTLTLGAASRLAAAPSLQLGGQITLGGDETVAWLQGSGTVALGAHTLSTNAAASTVFDGSTTGTGTLAKVGNFTSLTLTGALAHTGLTTVNGGTLVLVGDERLHNSSRVNVATGALLQLGGTETVAELTLGGTLGGTGTLVAAQYTLDGGDTRATAAMGAGTLTSLGLSAIKGTSAAALVQVDSGTLTLDSSERLLDTAAVTVATGAALALGGTETIGSLDLAGTLGNAGHTLAATTTTLRSGAVVDANLAGNALVVQGPSTLNGQAGVALVSIVNGTLSLAATADRLADTAAVTVAGTGGLALAGDETVASLTLAGSLAGSGHVLHSTGLTTLQSGADVDAHLGAATLLVTGNSSLQGTAAATTVQVAGGQLSLGSAGRLTLGAQVQVDGGAALLLGGDETISSLTLAGSLDGAATLSASTYSFSGGTANAHLGTGTLTVTAGGTLAGTAAVGSVVVQGGSLSLAAADRLTQLPAVDVGAAGTLALGGSQTLGSLAGSGAVLLSSHTLNTGVAGDSSFSGGISGSGGLVKQGNTTFTLGGSHSHTGGTTVSAGQLALGAAHVLPDTGTVQVQTGATLALAGDDTVGALALAGTVAGSGTLTAGTYSLSNGNLAAGAALGAGALSSSGNSTLAGTAAAGTVNVTSGSLLLNGASRLTGNPGVTVASGATLHLAGAQSVGTLALAGTLAGSGHTITATTTTLQTGAAVDANLGGGTLQVAGDATLTGTAASDVVNVAGGNLGLASAGRLGAGAAVTVSAGRTLTLAGAETVSTLTLAGTLAGTGHELTANSYALQAGASVLANLGQGTLTVTGNSTLAGSSAAAVVHLNAGTLTLASAERLANNAAVTLLGAATLTLNGDDTVASVASSGTINGSGTLLAGTYSLTGGVYDADIGGGALTATGANLLNGRSAATSLDVISGTLTLGAAGRFTAQPDVTVRNAATLRLGGDETFSSLAGAGAVDLQSHTLTSLALSDTSFSGALSGTGSLVKNGPGVFTLAGNNSYTGSTQVNSGTLVVAGTLQSGALQVHGGTLALDGSHRLANGTAVTVASGAAMTLAGDDTVASLALAGTLAGTGTLTAATYALDGGTVHANLGTGALSSVGLSTLNGTAAASTVAVDAGSLSLGAADRLAGPAAVTVAATASLDLGADQTLGSLAGAGTVNLGSFTLSTGALGSSTFAGTVAGTGGLVKQGSGSFTLSGGNTYSGSTRVAAGTLALQGTLASSAIEVDAGTLALQAAERLANSATLHVASGAQATLAGDETVAALTLGGTLGGSATLHAASYTLDGGTANANLGAGTLTSTGASQINGTAGAGTVAVQSGSLTLGGAGLLAAGSAVTVASGATLTTAGDNTVATLTLAGTLSGTGTFTAATTTFEGGTAHANLGGGSLQVNAGGTLAGTSAASNIAVNGGTFHLASAQRFTQQPAVTVGAAGQLQLGGDQTLGSLAGDGSVVLGAHTLATGVGGDSSFAGVMSGSGALTKQGAGSFTLSGTNTYTGATTVAAGTLALGAAHTLADSTAVQVASGATLALAGADTVASLALAGTVAGTGTLTAGSYTLTSGSVATGANLGLGTLSSSGSSSLAGTAAAGTVSVPQGTLTLASAHRLTGTPAVDVASAATLLLAGEQNASTLTLAGTLAGSGHTFNATTTTLQTGAAVAANLGAGSLQVDGNATLSGTAGSGTVHVTGGNLSLASAGRLASGADVTVAGGRTLTLGGDESVHALTLAGTLAGSGHTLTAGQTTLQTGALVQANLGLGALAVNGNATLTGSAGAGTVQVNAGTLTLSAGDRLSDAAAVRVEAGAALTLAADDTVLSLSSAGTINGPGTLFAGAYSLTGGIYNADIGGGTLTATGNNRLNGRSAATSVDVISGTLTLGSAGRFTAAPDVTVRDAATLRLGGAETFSTLAGGGAVDLQAHTLTSLAVGDSSYTGVMTGSGGLVKSGPGVFTLAGDNTYTGSTRVEAGTLQVQGTLQSAALLATGGTLALGAADRLANTATVSVGTGAAMVLAGDDTVASLALSGSLSGTGTLTAAQATLDGGTATANLGAGNLVSLGFSTLAGTSAAGTVAVNGGSLTLAAANRLVAPAAVTLANGASLVLQADQTLGSLSGAGAVDLASFTLSTGVLGSSSYAGAMAGSGGLVKQGTGTFTMSGSHSYTGTTRVDAGTLALQGTLASAAVQVNGGTLALASAQRLADTATLSVASGAVATLAGDETVAALSLAGTLAGNGTLTATTYALDGGTANAPLGAGSLQSQGNSALNGTAAVGTLAVNAGTLTLGGADRLTAGPVATVAAGASLQLGGNQTLGSLAGQGNVGLAAFTLHTGAAGDSSFGGVISGSAGTGGLVKQGSSTFTLTGANTYSGATQVQAGTLLADAVNVLPDASAVTVDTGATLAVDHTDTVATLALAGTLAGTGTLTAATTTLNAGTAHANLGAGTLLSNGESQLNGTSAAATVAVNTGRLTLGAAGRLADNAHTTVASGATLRLAGSDTVGQLVLAGTLQGTGTLTAASYTLSSGTADLDLGTGSLSSTGSSRINNLAAANSVSVDSGTLTLGAAQRLTALPAVAVASGATLTLGGDETLGTLAGSGQVGLQAFTLRSGVGGDSSFAGVLQGTGGLVKQGNSTFTLSGANTTTGATQVDAGTLALAGTLASGAVAVNAGTLALGAANRLADSAAVRVASGALMTLAGDDTVASLALQGTLGGSGTLSAGTYTLDGGTANANLGAGTLVSSGQSTLAGTAAASTVAVNGGTLALTAAERLVALPALTVATGATLQLGAAQTVGSLQGAGTVALDRFALSTGSLGDSTFDGVLSGTGALVKQGNSRFTLTGANTTTGATQVDAGTLALSGTLASQSLQVNAGTLALAAAHRLADGATVAVASGARMTLAGDDTVASLALAGTLAGTGTLSAASYALDSGTVDAQLGAGALRSVGASTLNGTAAAGTVAVDAGTLTLSAANRLVAGPAVDVATGATLALRASQVIGSLLGSGTVQLGGFTLSTGDLASSSFAGSLAGSGGIVKTGSSTFTLSGDSSYTGSTVVQGGTLAVAGTLQSASLAVQNGNLALASAHRLADGAQVSVASGAQFTLSGNDTVGTLALAGTLAGDGTLTATSVQLDGGTVLANLGGGALSSTGSSTLSGTSAASTLAVQAGVLTLSSGQRLSALPAVTLDTGATLQLAGDQALGTLAGAGHLALAGFTATTGAGGDSTFAGVASGSGGLVKVGGSTFTLAGANSYTGHTRVDAGTLAVTGTLASATLDVAAGTLALAAPHRLADNAAVQVQSGAHFTLAGSDTIGSLWLAGTLAGSGTLTAASTTLQAGTAHLDMGTGALLSRGASSLAGLSAAGTVAVESGVLTLASGSRFTAAPATSVAAGAELLLGGNETLGSLAGAGTLALQGFTLTTGIGGDSSFAGVVQGSGGLVKQGSSQFTLAGANTYTGTTQVDAGTLAVAGTLESARLVVGAGATAALASPSRLADSAQVQVLAGGTLTLAGDDTVASVAIAGTLGGSGRLTAGSYTLDSGTVTADLGTGTLTSTGASTLGGTANASTVTVQTGSLALGAAGRLDDAAAVAVASGATLRLAGDDTVGTLVLAGTLAGTGTLSAATTTLQSGTVNANLGAGTLVSTGSSSLAGTSAAGIVAVDSGTLALGAAQRLTAEPALTVASAAMLQLGGDQSLGTLAGAGSVNLGASTLTTGSGGDSSYAGDLSGSGGLVKRGDSVFTLTGSNSYTGNTTVARGTLRVGDGGSTGSLATAAFDLQGALVFNRNDAVTLAQPVSGTGTLAQAGTGTLTLAGHNKTYTGDTQVANGVLATADSDNLPDASAVVVQDSGRLTLGGSEILRSVTAQGTVALAGDLRASEDLLLSGAVTVPGQQAVKLTARRIDAANPGNVWGQSVSLDASDRVTLASGVDGATPRSLVLGTVNLAAGGRIDAGTLSLSDTTTLGGGTLELVSSAAPTISAPGAELALKQAVGLPLAYAADAVLQTGGSIELAAGATLQVHATQGGSVQLGSAGNRFLGSLQVLSGAAFGTGWAANATPGDFGKPAPNGYALQSRVQVAGSTVVVGGLGIEADVISLSADMLTTPTVNSVVPTLTARLPFDNTVGTEVSQPGLTLALTDASFSLAAPFGANNGGEIRINVGSRLLGNRTLPLNAGYVTVLPRGGARGSTAVLLAGPAVDSSGYRFFFDGAGVQGEVPVFYNGLLPVTPAVESSISSTVSVSESARKERFDEAIRTENVAVRLRAGVIAEVGPGRPATQGSEGARGPAACAPAVGALRCEAAP